MLTRIITILCLAPCISFAQPIVMGYWENWDTYANYPMPNNAANNANANLSAQIQGLNALAYAFLETTADGTIQFSDVYSDLGNTQQDQTFCNLSPTSCPNYPANAGLGNFAAFAKTSVAHHVVSIGGASHDASWEAAFAHPGNFTQSLGYLIQVYGIDWLDIDYEPVGGVPSSQTNGLINLIASIHQQFPNLIISYTIPANDAAIRNFGAANWQKLAVNVNYVSIMGYDMHGVFDTSNPVTNLHSPLVAEAGGLSDAAAIQALNDMGVANPKIILGAPMYGRAVGGVSNAGLQQPFTQAVQGDLDPQVCSLQLGASNVCGGLFQYQTIADLNATPVNVNNILASVYSYSPATKTFISYDNPLSIQAKANFVKDQNLAGMMFWALRFDKPITDQNSLLAEADKDLGFSQAPTAQVKLELTNNDPNNPIIISLVTADKSAYYPFPSLSPQGQAGSDVVYTNDTSENLQQLASKSGVLVLLTPASGAPEWCAGSVDFTTSTYHHIQVYYSSPQPSCSLS